MSKQTTDEAAADLSHAVANFVLIVEQAANLGPDFMTAEDVGRYALERIGGLREALDNLKAAKIRADMDAADQAALNSYHSADYCPTCGQWKT